MRIVILNLIQNLSFSPFVILEPRSVLHERGDRISFLEQEPFFSFAILKIARLDLTDSRLVDISLAQAYVNSYRNTNLFL